MRGEKIFLLLYRIPILFAIIVTLIDNSLLITLSLQLAINLTFQSWAVANTAVGNICITQNVFSIELLLHVLISLSFSTRLLGRGKSFRFVNWWVLASCTISNELSSFRRTRGIHFFFYVLSLTSRFVKLYYPRKLLDCLFFFVMQKEELISFLQI